MKALVSGIVMEVYKRDDGGKKVECVRLYQKGNSRLLSIKGVPEGVYAEGEEVEIPCYVYAWVSDRGVVNLGLLYGCD